MLALLLVAGVAGADMTKGLEAVDRRDWATALKEFRPLAEKGDADAQVNLGNLYMKGYGVEQDYGEARRWYLKAADHNNATAEGKLGLMHYYGLGVEENHVEAARWFRAAAEQGEAGAASILGSLYAAGDGVAKDKVEAYVWYTVAADRGNQGAGDSRQVLAEEMSPGEIDEALTRLAVWRKQHEPAMAEEGSPAGKGGAKHGKSSKSGKSTAHPAPKGKMPPH